MGGQWEAQSGKGIGMQYARLRHSLPGKKALILSLGCCTGELPYAEQHPWEPDLVGLGGAQPSTFWKSSLGDFNVQPSLRAFDLLGQRDKDRRTEEATVSDRLCAPFSQSFPPPLTWIQGFLQNWNTAAPWGLFSYSYRQPWLAFYTLTGLG